MPICERCGEDKPGRGFAIHVKSCAGKNTIPDNTNEEKNQVVPENVKSLIPDSTNVQSSKTSNNKTPDNTIDEFKKQPKEDKKGIKLVENVRVDQDEEFKIIKNSLPYNTNKDFTQIEPKVEENSHPYNTNKETPEVDENKIPDNTIELKIISDELTYLKADVELFEKEIDELKAKSAQPIVIPEIDELKKLIRTLFERTQNFSMDHNNLRKEVLDGVSETNKLKTSISEIEELKEKILNLKDCVEFVEDEIETLKDKSEIGNLKTDVESLKAKSVETIPNHEIEELKNDVVELKKVSSVYAKHNTNLEQTIPKLSKMPMREMERIKPDKIDGNVKFLVAASIFLLLLWVIL